MNLFPHLFLHRLLGKFRLSERLSESVNLGNIKKVFESLDILNFQGYSVLLKLQRLQVEIGKLSE